MLLTDGMSINQRSGESARRIGQVRSVPDSPEHQNNKEHTQTGNPPQCCSYGSDLIFFQEVALLFLCLTFFCLIFFHQSNSAGFWNEVSTSERLEKKTYSMNSHELQKTRLLALFQGVKQFNGEDRQYLDRRS